MVQGHEKAKHVVYKDNQRRQTGTVTEGQVT